MFLGESAERGVLPLGKADRNPRSRRHGILFCRRESRCCTMHQDEHNDACQRQRQAMSAPEALPAPNLPCRPAPCSPAHGRRETVVARPGVVRALEARARSMEMPSPGTDPPPGRLLQRRIERLDVLPSIPGHPPPRDRAAYASDAPSGTGSRSGSEPLTASAANRDCRTSTSIRLPGRFATPEQQNDRTTQERGSTPLSRSSGIPAPAPTVLSTCDSQPGPRNTRYVSR